MKYLSQPLSGIATAFLATFTLSAVQAQHHCDHPGSHKSCTLEAVYEDQFTFITPPENFVFGEERDANIVVNYSGFTAEAQAAFAYAVDIWASVLNSDITIVINANFSATPPNVLGYASADGYFKNFSGAPYPSTYYPEALANKLHGADLSPASEDLNCTFNSGMNWYYGTDGNVPSGKFDFVSVVLHELGHGLGFAGSGSANSLEGSIGFGSSLTIYDVFAEDLSGTPLDDYISPSAELGDVLTGGNVFWGGNLALSENNGLRPELYAPTLWNPGSSYSHLDESAYGAGSGNSLMTPFLGSAEAIHDPGAIVRGMFNDMGWEAASACNISLVNTGSQINCGQNGNTYDQQLTLSHENVPESGSLIVNEQSFPILESPQLVILQDLPSNGQEITLEISFSDDMTCTSTIQGEVLAPISCCAAFRLTEIDLENEYISITNFGDCQADISNYLLISENSFTLAGALEVVEGQRNLPSGEIVKLYWPAWNPGQIRHELALFNPNSNPDSADEIIDYVQWNNANGSHEALAVQAGLWGTEDFINAVPPYNFIGGENDYGVEYWSYSSLPCDITDISAGTQSGCDGKTQTYSQELIITYENPPSDGNLLVNGQSFPVTSSPQTVVLTGLIANGQPVIVNASFTESPNCLMSIYNIFSAPQPCEETVSGGCPGDLNGDGERNSADLLMIISEFGCSDDCVYDLTEDGEVNTSDMLYFLNVYPSSCN